MSEITDKNAVKQVCLNCLNFYIIASEEIQNRLPIKNADLFTNFAFLKPENALETSRTKIDFPLLCKKLRHPSLELNIDSIIEEWRVLPFIIDELSKGKLMTTSVEQFWWNLSKMKKFEDSLVFPNLTKLANIVLTLPHANADSERIFSIVNDVRTKKRNKLGHNCLNSICVIRSHFQDEQSDCIKYKWSIHKNIYDRMKYDVLYDHKKDK